MPFLEPDANQNQTEWKFGTWTFYANIPEEIKDLKIVENAKSIVDFAIPKIWSSWNSLLLIRYS